MLNPDLRDYIAKGYVKIGDIGYDIALNMRKGKNSTITQRNLYDTGIRMYLILDVLFRHVTFDPITLAPTLWRVTEDQVNNLLDCLIKLGDLNKVPIAPSLFPTTRPTVVTSGLQGPPGPAGLNGSDADIDVVLDPNEKQLKIAESVVAGVKTFTLKIVAYVKQLLSSTLSGGNLFEIGTQQSFNITLISTKGTENITAITCTDSPTNTILQSLLDLSQANGVTQPYQVIIPIANLTTNKTYTFNSNDGLNIIASAVSVSFVYPFFYGSNSSTSINVYTTLTKLIATQSNKSVVFNFTDQYGYFAYPASYGDLISIKDQNGFDVTASWTKTTITVSSSGLFADWSISYNVYRTTVKTTINNAAFTFNF